LFSSDIVEVSSKLRLPPPLLLRRDDALVAGLDGGNALKLGAAELVEVDLVRTLFRSRGGRKRGREREARRVSIWSEEE
jgi:hypothetical protein